MTPRYHDSPAGKGRRIMLVVFVASLIAWPPVFAQVVRGDVVEPCRVTGGTPRRVELDDGRIVSVDVQGVAVSGGLVMAVGRNAYVFPRESHSRTTPVMDSIIGVVIDSRGVVSLVPVPPVPGRVYYPRVAAGRDGSFHVLFASGGDSLPLSPSPTDTATIWYARYAGGTWLSPERVTAVQGAALPSELASELLVHNDRRAFLFPFIDNRNGETLGGLVLLERRDGSWFADTLRTERMPPMVRAVYDAGGESLTVLFSQFVTARGVGTEELYFTRFDSTWKEARYIAGDGERPPISLFVARVANGIIASWDSWRWPIAPTSRIEWLHMDSTGRVSLRAPIDSGESTYPFEMIVIDDGRPLWIYRRRQYGTGMSLATALGSVARRLPDVLAPFHNPQSRTVTLSPTRFLVFTMKLPSGDHEPMIASYTTTLEIRCPRSAQR